MGNTQTITHEYSSKIFQFSLPIQKCREMYGFASMLENDIISKP